MNSDREDILIQRVLSGEATEAEWTELENYVAIDSEAAARFYTSIRDDVALRVLTQGSAAAAQRVELPSARRALAPQSLSRTRVSGGIRGWLVAAALTVVCGLQFLQYPADAKHESYLVEELPTLLLEARAAVNGKGVEVLSLHRSVHREIVDSIHEIAIDDAGAPWLRAVPSVTSTIRTSL